MTKPHYRAILLVIASSNLPVYRFFRQLYLTYLNTNPHIKVFLVYGNSFDSNREDCDIIYDDLREQPGLSVIIKTIRAMEFIDANYSYDYFIRSNLSTFWDFEGLLATLKALPKEWCLAGSRLGYIPPPFIVGTGMIVTKNMVKELINQQDIVKNNPELTCIGRNIGEDRLLSNFFSENLGVSILPTNSIYNIEDLTSVDPIKIMEKINKGRAQNADHFRIYNRFDRARIDPAVGNLLCEVYYQRPVIGYET